MRNFIKVSIVGAIALASVACNTKEALRDNAVNPNYDPQTKEVTTQFVISVNTSTPQTKMKPEAVQQASNFRGIDNGHVLLFKSYNGTTSLKYVLDPSLKAEKDYPFATLMSSGDITASANKTTSSNRILQMSVPTGVNSVMVYGIAPKEGAHNAEGHMDYVVSDTPSNTSFTLARRIGDTDADITAYDQTGALMAFVLNRILDSQCSALTTADPAYLIYTELDPISWRELGILYENNNGHLHGTTIPFGGVTTARPLTALEESLGRAYSEFTYIKPGEYRAGSSTAIKKMMQDMYSVVTSIINATPGNAEEANAQRLANTIETRINNYFNGSWEYKSISDIHTFVVTTSSLLTETQWTDQFGSAKDLNKYPYVDFNIPEGAAQLEYDNTTGNMGYRHPNQALLNAGVDYDPRNYSYPVELAYCVNSPIRISTKDGLVVGDFVNGVDPWQINDNWIAKGWNSGIGVVEQSTRGIAVRDNISYGVALLKTNLVYDEAAPFTDYADNREAMTGEPDKTFSKADAKLSLKGVLVGGQNNQMDWQFLRKNTSPDAGTYSGADALIDPSLFNHVIYDDNLADAHVPTEAPNYTLVFDNYNSTESQNKVKVALEFVNGGDAFWGKDNIIPAGGTFYLVGELDPASPKSGSTVNWASATRQIPPIYLPGDTIPSGKEAGDSKEIARVFIQDYMTIANFKLNANSLKHAYLTVPDLRSAQMSLGLSVDLEWKSGFEFDVNL
jgi:hypothetical protein